MSTSFDFSGRTVLVTGAGRGIGLAMSAFFAEAGARLAMADVDEAALAEATTASEAGLMADAIPLTVDVSDSGAVSSAVEHLVESTGRLDVVVNNAGILRDRVVWKLTDDD